MTITVAKLSGYLSAAVAVVFSGTQVLDSLLDNEWASLSDEIDNSTNKYALVDLYLTLGSATFTGIDSAIEIYIVPCVDGTNYPLWTDNVTTEEQENETYHVATMSTSGSAEAQKLTFLDVPLPNGKYKYGVRNVGNVTLNAADNDLYWRPHSVAGDDA